MPSHIGKSVLPDRLPDIVMNIGSKTAAGQSHADDALGKGNDVVASMSTLQRNPTENRRKQIHCKNCGSIIDNATKRCTGCGKQHFRAKLVIPYIAMFQIISNPVKASSYWGRMSRIGSSHLPLTGRKVVMFLLTTPEAQRTFPSTKTLGLLQPK